MEKSKLEAKVVGLIAIVNGLLKNDCLNEDVQEKLRYYKGSLLHIQEYIMYRGCGGGGGGDKTASDTHWTFVEYTRLKEAVYKVDSNRFSSS